MKKKLILTFIVLTSLATSLFAGGFDIALNSTYAVPVQGWEFDGTRTSYSETFAPGFVEELELGYGFESGIKVSVTTGFGFNEQQQASSGSVLKLYNIPLTIDGTFPLANLENIVFYTKVSLGADARFTVTDSTTNPGKTKVVIYLGPVASLSLGADIKLVEGLYLGLTTKVSAIMNFAGNGDIYLYYNPFGLNLRYQF